MNESVPRRARLIARVASALDHPFGFSAASTRLGPGHLKGGI